MAAININQLQRNLVYLQEHVNTAGRLLPFLIQSNILTWDEKEDLDRETNKSDRVFKLIDILRRKGPTAVEIFLEGLRQNDQQFICDEIVSNQNSLHQRQSELETDIRTKCPVEDYQERKYLEREAETVIQRKGKLALHGPSGSGKTQLARHITEKHKNSGLSDIDIDQEYVLVTDSDGCICATIQAASTTAVVRSLKGLASLVTNYGVPLTIPQHCDDERLCKLLLEKILNVLSLNNNKHVIVIEDVNQESKKLLPLRHTPKNVILIVTTNDRTLFDGSGWEVEVKGFNAHEEVEFYRKNNISQDSDTSIHLLGEKLGSLPLGFVSAKGYIKDADSDIESYLKLIESPSCQQQLSDSDSRYLTDYSKGLLSALHCSIAQLKENLPEESFTALSVAMFYDTTNFPIQLLVKILEVLEVESQTQINEESRNPEINKIVMQLKLHSLVQVTGCGENRVLEFHGAVPLAWRGFLVKEQERDRVQLLCLLTIVAKCDVDTRFAKRFQCCKEKMQHMEAALGHINIKPYSGLPVVIFHILVGCIVAHIYIQLNQTNKAKTYLDKAERYFYVNILHTTKEAMAEKIKRKVDEDPNCQNPLQVEAEYIMKEILNQHSLEVQNIYLSYLQVKTFSQDQIAIWKEFAPELGGPQNYCMNNSHLTKTVQEYLVTKDVMISKEKFSHVFPVEVFITIHFLQGRRYHFTDKSKVTPQQKQEHINHFKMVCNVCCMIKNQFDIRLYFWVLAKCYGLYYIKMEEEGKSHQQYVQDLRRTARLYEGLSKYSEKLYCFGVLIRSRSDVQNKAVCIREILGCYTKLQNMMPSGDERRRMKTKKEEKTVQLEAVIEEMKGSQTFNNLHTPNSFLNELGRSKMSNGDRSSTEEAIQLFEKVLDDTMATNRVPYTMNGAIDGLVTSQCKLGRFQDARASVQKLEVYINQLFPGGNNNPVFDEDDRVMQAKYHKVLQSLHMLIDKEESKSQSTFKRLMPSCSIM